jgi:site-specific recombinase XerD
VSVVKSFTRKFVYKALDMTRRDLLERVERFQPPVRVEEGYSQDWLELILSVNDGSDKYVDVRDRALLAFFAASGLRYTEVVLLGVDQVDRYSGRVRTIGKGGKEREVRIGERALKALRRYLGVRRARYATTALWTTDEGKPLTYDSGQKIFARLKEKTGIANLHAHRFRHTWAQVALRKGAERALVQDQLGWSSDQMVKRYSGFVRTRLAADSMPKFAPI